MASTSASTNTKRFKYDVFLSFRGEDTRMNFVDRLYHALQQNGIKTYKDDERLVKGEEISYQLIKSIKESRFYIIVFSKNYASSSWCLKELEEIMDCQKMTEHTAYPVFYDVEPTEVRNQSGAVEKAFEKHVEKEDAGIWRDALKRAADLAGWELKNTFNGHEAKFIQNIVFVISTKLRLINFSYDEKLVGMTTRVNDVVSSLKIGSDDVRMIGIKGLGGGGKTTLARVVFDCISIWFEGKSFVENVREVSQGYSSGLEKLQEQVLKDLSNENLIDVASVYEGKDMMKKVMCSRKVLLVLDDVDDVNQLEALVGELSWFRPGSRIIITTRDEEVLVRHQVKFIHDTALLSDEEAICLLSRYAFGTEIPIKGYEELSRKVVDYVGGLPLTIKVLGSHLCGKSKLEWADAIEKLKTIPLNETLEKLELSYNDLANDEKEIFLDVACILKGELKDKAIRVIESYEFHAEICLRVLEQKSLVTISSDDCLSLHDHIQEMGRNIVRHLYPNEPNRHSRLWIKREIEDILANDLGTEAIRCIKLKNSVLHPKKIMEGLRKMKELRLLYLDDHQYWEIDEVDQYLPNALQSLNWHYYPFRCLPNSFQASKLVNLEMPHSYISELWKGGKAKVLSKLRFLNLIFSRLRTLNIGLTPHLETLDLRGCRHFGELHVPVECPKLKYLNLSGSRLRNLDLGLTPHLETLDLRGCGDFEDFHVPVECPKLKYLNLSGSRLKTLDLGLTPHLETLDLGGCGDFEELHVPVECPKLKYLNLRRSRLRNLDLGLTPHLEALHLGGCCNLEELHVPVECPKLKYLNLSCSTLRNLDLGLTPHLETLDLGGCGDFVEHHVPVECPKLKYLNLSGSRLRNLDLGLTPHLETLDLRGYGDFEDFHVPVECPKLKYLNLRRSRLRNLDLGLTPNLEALDLGGCCNLEELHVPVECPKLKYLNLSCSMLRNLDLGLTPHLEKLDLRGCGDFEELHVPVECPKLKYLNLSGSRLKNLDLRLTPHLETLDLGGCRHFEELHVPVECLQLKYLDLNGSKVSNLKLGLTPHLKKLCLGGCNEFVELHMPAEIPKLKYLDLSGSRLRNLDFGLTPYLEELKLGGCNYFVELHMPVVCQRLKHLDLNGSKVSSLNLGLTPHLEMLDLKGCNDFVELCVPVQCPKLKFLNLSGSNVSKFNLNRLENLEELTLSIKNIMHLPDSICMLKHLKSLELKSCFLLENLPEDLDKLQGLEKLQLSDCVALREIPSNICNMNCLKYLHLPYCNLVTRLPEELGRLKRMKELNIVGTGIQNLPASIFQLKDLCVVWSRGGLERNGFTILKTITKYTASSYVYSCK